MTAKELAQEPPQDKVPRLLSCNYAVPQQSIRPESFLGELGLDSLDIVELCVQLDDEYGIVTEDDDVARLSTVRSVVDFYKGKIEQKPK